MIGHAVHFPFVLTLFGSFVACVTSLIPVTPLPDVWLGGEVRAVLPLYVHRVT